MVLGALAVVRESFSDELTSHGPASAFFHIRYLRTMKIGNR